MKKIYLFAIMAIALMACNPNEPENTKKTNEAFIGTWEPVGYEEYDVFVITADSIKAVKCDSTAEEHLQCYYEILNDSVVKLERYWLEEKTKDYDWTNSDFHPEKYYVEEVAMYLDKDGYLIIYPFDIIGELAEVSPNYTHLKLKRK